MRCERNGCTGSIVDGFCDVCWMAPVRRTTSATVVVGAVGLDSAPEVEPTPRRTQRTGTTATRVTRLAAGLVEFPPIAERDPLAAVMVDPVVPE